jgi:hypothetical protein
MADSSLTKGNEAFLRLQTIKLERCVKKDVSSFEMKFNLIVLIPPQRI